MRYMFLIIPARRAKPSRRRPLGAPPHQTVMRDAAAQGIFLGADPLEPTTTATTLRTKDGRPSIIDGPFAETKEQLAGYYMLDCRDLDEAIDWAKQIPFACQGSNG